VSVVVGDEAVSAGIKLDDRRKAPHLSLRLLNTVSMISIRPLQLTRAATLSPQSLLRRPARKVTRQIIVPFPRDAAFVWITGQCQQRAKMSARIINVADGSSRRKRQLSPGVDNKAPQPRLADVRRLQPPASLRTFPNVKSLAPGRS
jgi:hypothetical protein